MPREIFPPGVTLTDPGDFEKRRADILDGVKEAFSDSFPKSFGGIKMHVDNLAYEGDMNPDLQAQKQAIMDDKYLTVKLRGDMHLTDEKTGQLLDKQRMSLLRVPVMTERGTFIRGGNEIVSAMQSRLLPGTYTRRQDNGMLENHMVPKPGTGVSVRVGLEPDTAQYRLKVQAANLHLYSLLKDIGVPDARLVKEWGQQIFEQNAAKYDARVFDKAYKRLVYTREQKSDATREEKAAAITAALDRSMIHERTARKNLPNMFDEEKSAEWRGRYAGIEVMEKMASVFAPDLTASEVDDEFEHWKGAAIVKPTADVYIIKGNPEVDTEHAEQYNNFYNNVANIAAGKGLSVAFDAGLPHTTPPGGKYWIGHSRGVDRLQYAPEGVKTLALDDFEPIADRAAINTAYDKLKQKLKAKSVADIPVAVRPKPLPSHYTLNDEAVSAINALLDQGAKSASFEPDLHADDMKDEFNSVVGKAGPRLASMKTWPEKWLTPGVPHGWLLWYRGYCDGKRTEEDDKQKARWSAFKAKHGAEYVRNPTARRGFCLRNWGINPIKLLPESAREEAKKDMAEYKEKAKDNWLQEKSAVFHINDLVALSTFLNKECQAGINVNSSSDSMESQIIAFLNDQGVKPGLMVQQAPPISPDNFMASDGLTDAAVAANPMTDAKIAAAEGIPDRSDFGDMSKIKEGDVLDFVTQRHNAHRAGEHFDVRLGNEKTGLFSWATKKDINAPHEGPIQLFQQPLHTHAYKDFEGTIPDGQYGAGEVSKQSEGKVLVGHVRPGVMLLSTAGKHPTRFALIQPHPGGDWLFQNAKVPETHKAEKSKYLSIPPEQAEAYLANLPEGSIVQPKVDGALNFLQMADTRPEIVSHRTSRATGKPVLHTERFFRSLPKLDGMPPELKGMVAKMELFGERKDGSTIPPNELGALLNSTVANSLELQKARGVTLKGMLFDLQHAGGQNVSGLPYKHRLQMLEALLPHLPEGKFELPESAETPEAAVKMLRDIQSGNNPRTVEGIVIQPPTGSPARVKFVDDQDVHIRGVYPGEGKYADSHGGFTYSHTPDGPVVGAVGGGFDDETRQLLGDYIGRIARVRSRGRFDSGALRDPRFIALHESYPHDDSLTVKNAADEKLKQLIKAKDHSDKKEYTAKNNIMAKLMHDAPEEFDVDSDDGKITGITHAPTGFRIHVPAGVVPAAVRLKKEAAAIDWDAVEKARKQARKDTGEPKSGAQAESGNYKHGRFTWNGLEIVLENPKGTMRRDKKHDPPHWEQRMSCDYGYIGKSLSKADGDAVDCFVGEDLASPVVYIIDQQKESGTFDEHKAVLACHTEEEARELYLGCYEKGWKGLKAITALTAPQFKLWVMGDTTHKEMAKHKTIDMPV